ncbi:alpha/beta hydrolase [Candidatus Roizmanbacteria bacterium]|nr:alpha/beta hydrolase [Candidatus Roizmanbacteria bacterium]
MVTNVSFENINNKKIFQIFTEPEVSQKKIVIMSHGFRSSTIGPARTFVNFEKILLNNGFSVLRFDQPNSGNSEGDFIDSSFTEWVDTTTYLAKKYIEKGYKVCLLGQSMGATTTMAVTSRDEVKNKILCIILWVPDPESSFDKNPENILEEEGQKYKELFWKEACETNFFKNLKEFTGGIHLVYGETDKYVVRSSEMKPSNRCKKKANLL